MQTELLRYTGARPVKQNGPWQGRAGLAGSVFRAPRRSRPVLRARTRQQGCRATQPRRFPPEWFRGAWHGIPGSLASVSRRGSRVPTEAAGLAGALTDAPCASGGRFEPRATCPRGVPPRRTEPRTAGASALSGNSPQALDRCRERSLLERVPGGFRTSATARFTLAGVNRAYLFR